MTIKIKVENSLASIQAKEWDRLSNGHPLLSHAFLDGLQKTQCIGENSGWIPQYLTLYENDQLQAAMPLYLKMHSYGEYVFDWAWADAYERAGFNYYPKLLNAIPFSPVSGNRLLVSDPSFRRPLIDAALSLAKNAGLSSFHCLFPNENEMEEMHDSGLLLRTGVQFHWQNKSYRSFDEFLATMSHDKRKKIRQERRKVYESGIRFRRLTGKDIKEEDWKFFYQCYVNTYRTHHSTPYLNLPFFLHLGENMADKILLIMADVEGGAVASAFNLYNAETLYGRYWGTTVFSSGLHFETCYYQALEFCIERGISCFEGGAQGEHKLARGFTPVKTLSMHWLARPEFSSAVERYLERESIGIDNYIDELKERQPYKLT